MGENIITDSKEINRKGVDWINLVPGKNKRRDVVNTVMNIRVP